MHCVCIVCTHRPTISKRVRTPVCVNSHPSKSLQNHHFIFVHNIHLHDQWLLHWRVAQIEYSHPWTVRRKQSSQCTMGKRWYHDDARWCVCRNHKMMVSWWCVCRNHKMMISWCCVCRNHKMIIQLAPIRVKELASSRVKELAPSRV